MPSWNWAWPTTSRAVEIKAKAIEKYRDRLLFLHINDVEAFPDSANVKSPYRFVELGRACVDLPAVFDALHKVNSRGWAIVEFDAVPDKYGTPKESVAISKKYLHEKTSDLSHKFAEQVLGDLHPSHTKDDADGTGTPDSTFDPDAT